MRKYVANCAWLGLAFSVIMTVVTAILCRDILVWMKTPANIIDGAHNYIFIIFIGIPTVFLVQHRGRRVRATGDSKTPVVFLSAVFQLLILCWICILSYPCTWAWRGQRATVISQGVSGVACLVYMVKKFEILRIHREEWKVDGHMMMVLCGMGVPMGLQYSITAIGSVILQTAANTLGSAAVAAMTAGGKIGNFLACPFDAMGSTMATYGGQNVGAGKLDRLGKGLKSCVLLGVGYSVIAFLIAVFFGGPLAQLFVDGGEAEIIANVCAFLLWNTAFYIPLALVNIVRFLIQGMGFPKFAILAGVFEMIARSPGRLWTGANHRLHRGMPGQSHCLDHGGMHSLFRLISM